MSTHPRTEATVKSARRVLEVLEHFASHHAPATVTELSVQLGYPQSSTSVLLSSLVELGYLSCDRATRTYRPTLRVMLLGAWMHDELFGEGSLVSELDKLRKRTGCTVMVGARQNIYTRVMLVLWRTRRRAPNYAPGSQILVPRSSLGKVLLAGERDEEISRIVRRANAEMEEPGEAVTPQAFLREVELFRQRGWAETLDFPRPGLAAIAVALPPLAGHPPMALALGASRADLERGRHALVAALRDTVARIRRTQSLSPA